MALILGIETSCDETAAAVYDLNSKKILSSCLFSQVKLHEVFGGVVPEIASRSHIDKIDIIISQALTESGYTLDDISYVAVTNGPGLVGSLLVGLCFAKGIAWTLGKKLIGVNHLEGHIFSSFIKSSDYVEEFIYPHLCLSVSGGHTSFYIVNGFGKYEQVGQTLDDAAGEAFDKIGYILGLGYPGGATIERLAEEFGFKDLHNYPRGKVKDLNVSFSGLKTAVIYDLVKRGAFDLNTGVIKSALTPELIRSVSSSLLVCIADVFERKLILAFKKYPEIKGFSFVGGVACNNYITSRLKSLCKRLGKEFTSSIGKFATDNAAMIAVVAGYMVSTSKLGTSKLGLNEYSLDVVVKRSIS